MSNLETTTVYNLRQQLQLELEHRDQFSMRRQLRTLKGNGPIVQFNGQQLINLASNDYLGLANHPYLKRAASEAINTHGTGSGASKVVTGQLDLHERVENQFATFKHAESALLFPTGYMANLAVLTSLAGPGDLICLDKLSHTSLIEAARSSGATVRSFPHFESNKLCRLLERHLQASSAADHNEAAQRQDSAYKPLKRPSRRFIAVDSVFSMDGDTANLPELVGIAQKYDATLIVDEAHGTGILGQNGTGLCESQGVTDQVDIVISTASKALGGLGGIVTADKIITDTILNHGKSLVYTTSIPPSQAAAIGAAVEVIQNEPHLRADLQAKCQFFRQKLTEQGWQLPLLRKQSEITPIFPLTVGSPKKALAASEYLMSHGFLAFASRYPTVPRGQDRIRISLRVDIEYHSIEKLAEITKKLRDMVSQA